MLYFIVKINDVLTNRSLTTKTALPPYTYYKEKTMENNTDIKAILINKNLVVLAGSCYSVVLSPCYDTENGDVWSIVCDCGCSKYQIEKAEEMAKKMSCQLLHGESAEDFLEKHGFDPCHCTKEEIENLLLLSKSN